MGQGKPLWGSRGFPRRMWGSSGGGACEVGGVMEMDEGRGFVGAGVICAGGRGLAVVGVVCADGRGFTDVGVVCADGRGFLWEWAWSARVGGASRV